MEDDEEEERLPVVPLGDKKLRACLVTGLVKTEEQAALAKPPRLARNSRPPPCMFSGCATGTTTFRA